MVLDTINENGELIFKNTHTNNKKHTIKASDPSAPDEFYFIHIEPKNNQISQTSPSSLSSSMPETNRTITSTPVSDSAPVPVPDVTGVVDTDDSTSSD